MKVKTMSGSAFVFEESYMTASGYLLIDETFHGSF